MKKSVLLVSVFVVILLLVACGVKVPETNTAENGVALDLDEYYVYENGEVTNDLSTGSGDFYSENAATKRGIKVGSTLAEVADTYNGVECSIYADDMNRETTGIAVPCGDFIDNKVYYNGSSLTFDTFVIDGQLYSKIQFLEFGDEHGLSTEELRDNGEYDVQMYTMTFYFENGMVDLLSSHI